MADYNLLRQSLKDVVFCPALKGDEAYQNLLTNGLQNFLAITVRGMGYESVDEVPLEQEEVLFWTILYKIVLSLKLSADARYDVEGKDTKILQGQRAEHYEKTLDSIKDYMAVLESQGSFTSTMKTYNVTLPNSPRLGYQVRNCRLRR